MHALYLLSVWLHVLAAITWIGGMFFLVLVVVPWLRSGGRANAGVFLRETGLRFRSVGWSCFALLVLTGTFNLWYRGVRLGDFASAAWLSSPFGRAVALKLALFAAVLAISAVHDFSVGPRATVAVERDPASAETAQLRRRASLLGRANALLALLIVAAAIVIVRGWP
ncbi:MAG: CopD family protein [Polyangiales bacterium]